MLGCPLYGSATFTSPATEGTSFAGAYPDSRPATLRHVSKQLPTVSLITAQSKCYSRSLHSIVSHSSRRSRLALARLEAIGSKQQDFGNMDGHSSGPILKVLSFLVNLYMLTQQRHGVAATCSYTPLASVHERDVCASVAAGCGALGRWSQPYRGAA